jgi:nickel-dependent lactate racemase
MVDVWLPYGKSDVCVRVPARNLLGSIEPKEVMGVSDSKAEIERSLREVIGSKRLSEIANSDSKVAIVVDDQTRHSPTSVMILPVLAELQLAGVKDDNVTVVSHDCKAQDLVYVGTTRKHGNKIFLNRDFAEADVKVLLGDVGFHYYAGYGGGRKSVMPAVAGEETIKHNHAMLLNSNAHTGILNENPVHEDMTEAARLAKVDFILNVVTNRKGEIVKAFAGDLQQAFDAAVKLVDEIYRVEVDRRADIVVVSPGGYPADINLYQAYKALDNSLEVVKRGGVVILVAECPEGHGNQIFYEWMMKFEDLRAVEREIKRNFELGGHKAYYLLKALQNHQIILVSSLPDYYASNIFKMKTARAVNDALREAMVIAGSQSRIWTINHGNFTLPRVKAAE